MIEDKTIQIENQIENVSSENQSSDNQNQNYERLVQEIQNLKEHILNVNFKQETPFHKEEEKTEPTKQSFKLG